MTKRFIAFVPLRLPLLVLRAILLEVVLHDGDVVIRTLALLHAVASTTLCAWKVSGERLTFLWLDSRFY